MSKQGDREKLVVRSSNVGSKETMDVTGSLRKIARELLSLDESFSKAEIFEALEGASWLITYIANALDVELQHAAARGMKQITP